MLMFREEKSPEDEIKAWQFWHGRQHSVKQRILDAGKSTLGIRSRAMSQLQRVNVNNFNWETMNSASVVVRR